MSQELESEDGNPPLFSPPALRVQSAAAGKDGQPRALIISQTPNILLYLGDRLGLVPSGDDEEGKLWVQQLALTALDLNNEVHDTHHPIVSDSTSFWPFHRSS